MKRFYVYTHALDNTILIDTLTKSWAFYNTNIYGQFHNLSERPKKVSAQRINGLLKRLTNGSHYSFQNSYVVDQYIYNYFFTDKQREAANHPVDLRAKLVTSGDDFNTVVTAMCEDLLDKTRHSKYIERNYYKRFLEEPNTK